MRPFHLELPAKSFGQNRTKAGGGELAGFPRFIREYPVAPYPGEVLIDGSQQLQIIRGRAAEGFLPKLIDLMDGTKTPQQLAANLAGVPRKEVFEAIAQLRDWGFVEEGAGDARQTVACPNALAFFKRYANFTGKNRSGIEAYNKVQRAQIAVLSDGVPEQHLASMETGLRNMGFQNLSLLDASEVERWSVPIKDLAVHSLIISMSFGAEDCLQREALDELCAPRGIPWLRGAIDEVAGFADIGPVFNWTNGSCFRCFSATYLKSAKCVASDPNGFAPSIFVSLLALEAAFLVSRIGPLVSSRGFRRYELESWQSQDMRTMRLPSCSRCFARSPIIGTHMVDAAISPDLAFEEQVALPGREVIDPKAYQESSKLSVVLSREAKKFLHSKQRVLPKGIASLSPNIFEAYSSKNTSGSRRLDIETLSTLLVATAGIREPGDAIKMVQRWSATAGNLGSVELFIAAHQVDDLDPGFYFYQPFEHSLASLTWQNESTGVDDFMRQILGDACRELPQVLVFFTAALHRVMRKYGAFGYRLIHFDAGVALSQCHLMADCLGVAAATLDRLPFSLIQRQFHLKPRAEHATAVVALGLGAQTLSTQINSVVPELTDNVALTPSAPPAESFYGLSTDEVLAQIQEQIASGRANTNVKSRGHDSHADQSRSPRFDSIPLTHSVVDGPSVGDILHRRCSVRTFSTTAVTISQLSTVLHSAAFGRKRAPPKSAADLLSFTVIAQNVEGLKPCIYRLDLQNSELLPSSVMLQEIDVSELFVQEEFGGAPLLIWITGDLRTAGSRHGVFGHGLLLSEAGSAAHRGWMSAISVGLGGTIVAGIAQGAARKLMGFDGYRNLSLLALAIGYPVHGQ